MREVPCTRGAHHPFLGLQPQPVSMKAFDLKYDVRISRMTKATVHKM